MPNRTKSPGYLETVLLAPYDYMDKNGNDAFLPRRRGLSRVFAEAVNHIRRPEIRVGLFTLGFCGSVAAGAGLDDVKEKMAQVALVGGGVYVARRTLIDPLIETHAYQKITPGSDDYWITPNTKLHPPRKLSADVAHDLAARRQRARLGMIADPALGAFVAAMGYAAVAPYMAGEVYAADAAMYLVLQGTHHWSVARRSDHVLNGHWSALERIPPVDLKKQKDLGMPQGCRPA